MTRSRTARRRSLPATVLAIAALSGGGFAAISGGLAYQMAAGQDPALGPKARTASAQPAHRRIVRRTIIVRKVRDAGTAPSSAPANTPAPVSAPAPAPPPAPIVTKVS